MRTGCRCRKTFDSITSTRLRSVFGRSWRNTDVHTCVSVSQFQKRVAALSCGLIVLVSVAISGIPSESQKRLCIDPLSQLELELPALVDEDLAILGEHNAVPLERTRRRPLEVDARRPEAAAVAGALELRLGGEEVRRAAEMGAGGVQHVKAAGAMDDIVVRPHDPHAVRFLEALVDADTEVRRKPNLELLRRLVEY